MAKRKRLTPANPDQFHTSFTDGVRAPETKSLPPAFSAAPIAQVAGEASATAALADLADAVADARSNGQMIDLLPLAHIDTGYLVRDRLEQDGDEMGALVDSIRARGQQTPIEVIRLPAPVDGMTHGLISGWRRLTALNRLYSETHDDRFATVRALVVAPGSAQDAYVAMVEENEIRVNLSHYERARIAVRAVSEGVYPTPRTALQGLYASTTRSKRSKIGSFIAVVEAWDRVLFHPTAISEKLGLSLARALSDDPGFADTVRARLKSGSRKTASDELRLLASALSDHNPAGAGRVAKPHKQDGPRLSLPGDPQGRDGVAETLRPGLSLRHIRKDQVIELSGSDVTPALLADLKAWLQSR